MHTIKVNSAKCSLCNSDFTKTRLEFKGGKYIMVVDCKNDNCISNNLERHPLSSSGKEFK